MNVFEIPTKINQQYVNGREFDVWTFCPLHDVYMIVAAFDVTNIRKVTRWAGGTHRDIVGGATWQDKESAINHIVRKAYAMTRKNALHGLDAAGCKFGILCRHTLSKTMGERDAYILLGEVGKYLFDIYERPIFIGEDGGTSVENIDTVAEVYPYAFGTSKGFGEPGQYTAEGIAAAMRIVSEQFFGEPLLSPIAIRGVGSVGSHLVRSISESGIVAENDIIVSDINAHAIESLVRDFPFARVVDPETFHRTQCGILAPCAFLPEITGKTINEFRCKAIVGGGNEQCRAEEVSELIPLLYRRGIQYLPDFAANGMGIRILLQEHRLENGESKEEIFNEQRAQFETLICSIVHTARTRDISMQSVVDMILASI